VIDDAAAHRSRLRDLPQGVRHAGTHHARRNHAESRSPLAASANAVRPGNMPLVIVGCCWPRADVMCPPCALIEPSGRRPSGHLPRGQRRPSAGAKAGRPQAVGRAAIRLLGDCVRADDRAGFADHPLPAATPVPSDPTSTPPRWRYDHFARLRLVPRQRRPQIQGGIAPVCQHRADPSIQIPDKRRFERDASPYRALGPTVGRRVAPFNVQEVGPGRGVPAPAGASIRK
jgi:hypothetical protein